MKTPRLHEVVLPMDRWSARAVSPVDISNGVNTDRYGAVVVVHPGWAKAPERHKKLLFKIADSGFLPIGVDTRYAYADRQQPRASLILQPMTVGSQNPYFEEGKLADNRWRYRRPTVLLEICRRLEIQQRAYIGHSEGARVSALAAAVNPEDVTKLIIINSAGTGDSSEGSKRMVKANANRLREVLDNRSEITEATKSAIGSTAYTLTHLRRTIAEKQVIQATNIWSAIDMLKGTGVDISVFHAGDDELISFADSAQSASERPCVKFIPTLGCHSNVYESAVQDLIVGCLE